MDRPSSRRVSTRLRLAGMPVSHQTIHRWKRNQWRPIEWTEHPIEGARRQLDDAAPLLTGDPMTNAEAIVKASGERAELENLPDGELLHQVARELAVDVIVVSNAFLRQPETIINKPGELAVLFRALTACAQAVSAAFVAPCSREGQSDGSAAP